MPFVMSLTLDKQIMTLRGAVASPELVARVPAPGGELSQALEAFGAAVKTMSFDLAGRLPMVDLRSAFDTQIAEIIGALPARERIKDILNIEVPFGVSTIANLIEVVPSVAAVSGNRVDPREIVRGEVIVRAATNIGLCPGQVAPIIRRHLTMHRDEAYVDWVRDGGIGNEKHDRYAVENFTINDADGLSMTDSTYKRILEDLRALPRVDYGGCPALRFMIGEGYGNLLTELAKRLRDTCVHHFDFSIPNDPLVRRDTTQQIVFPDPGPTNGDLYR